MPNQLHFVHVKDVSTFSLYHLIDHIFSLQSERLLNHIMESLGKTTKLCVFTNLRGKQ